MHHHQGGWGATLPRCLDHGMPAPTDSWRLLRMPQTGLARTLKMLPTVAFEHPDAFFPRCYELNDASTVAEFTADFRDTAALAVLRRHLDAVAVHECGAPRVRARLVQLALRMVEHRVRLLKGACVGVDVGACDASSDEIQALLEYDLGLVLVPSCETPRAYRLSSVSRLLHAGTHTNRDMRKTSSRCRRCRRACGLSLCRDHAL